MKLLNKKNLNVIYLIASLLIVLQTYGQGFATSATNWTVPIGGFYNAGGNWGFNALGGSADGNSILDNQTWSTIDINGDGMLDLVVTAQNNASGINTVFSPTSNPYWKVYLNTGSGFSTSVTNWPVPIGGFSNSTANWGFNAIGGSADGNSILNNQTWSTVDINGDGKPDLVVTAQNNASGINTVFSPTSNPYWKVYLNTGSGFSTAVTNWTVPIGGFINAITNWGFNAIGGSASGNSILNNQTWSTVDINGDGKPDLVVTAQNNASGFDTVFSPAANPYWKAYLNTGSGFSTAVTNWTIPVGGLYKTSGNWGFNAIGGSASSNSTLNSQTWSAVDINGDGKLDLVVTAQNDASGFDTVFSPAANPYWKAYLNTGSGFSTAVTNWTVPVGGLYKTTGNWGYNALGGSASSNSTLNNQTWSIVDLNGDGKLDLVVTAQNNASGSDTVFSPSTNPYWKAYFNTGSGFSTAVTNWTVPVGGLYKSTGNWGFNNVGGSASSNSILDNQTWSIIDINGDGKLDLVVTAQNNASGFDTAFNPAANPFWKAYLNLSILGVNDINNYTTNFEVFPNPSNGIFTIQNTFDQKDFSVEIYDILGKKIMQQKDSNEIDLSSSPKGIYLLKIREGNEIYTKKIIVL